MRRLGLVGICPRKWKTTTVIDHADAYPVDAVTLDAGPVRSNVAAARDTEVLRGTASPPGNTTELLDGTARALGDTRAVTATALGGEISKTLASKAVAVKE